MDQVRTFIEPVKKKWIYHFIISPKTNMIEKPEWYLNQTLKWMNQDIDVVESRVKLDTKSKETSKCCCSNIKHKFILCMIELAMLRLSKDMNKVSAQMDLDADDIQNEAILIHTYNEVIQFCKVIRQLLGIDCYQNLTEQHDLLSVFSKQKLFEKIIDVEWDYAEKNIKELTEAANRWDPILEGDFVDNYKIPRCTDRLLMLIKSITERVECFLQLDCQFKLIELQCFLFNKYLTFLKRSTEQSQSPVSMNILSDMLFFSDESTIDLTRVLSVLNGVNFLRLVLKDKYFIPKIVIGSNLDESLKEKANKLAQDYKQFFYKLIEKVVNIYGCVECSLQSFLNFIKPKLSHHIYEIIRDETSKLDQERQTENLLGGLSLSGK